MNKHVKIDENYHLISQQINNEETVEVTKNTNHIFVVDVSYSMYSDLVNIRKQLKNKLSNIMKDGDTISIVWFSGKNDSGILKEEVEVKSLKNLSDLNNAIDKWLQPIGMTAFHKPLQLVKELIGRIKINRPESIFSMIFLTDGYNNDCPWNDVTKTLKELENDINYSTFVEYGYYADTKKLTEMASIIGGEKISCDGFDEFEPIFDNKIKTNLTGGKKVLVELCEKSIYDFAFSIDDNGSVVLYNIQDNKILVSTNIKDIHFFSPNKNGENSVSDTTLYGAIYVLSDKLLNDDAEKIFSVLGDKYLFNLLGNAFGKQKLNDFKNKVKECITDESKRYLEGKVILSDEDKYRLDNAKSLNESNNIINELIKKGSILKINDNAYCLMNLIDDLNSFEDCVFYPNHKDFNYNRIGRKRVAKGTNLNDTEKEQLLNAKNIEEADKILNELKEKNKDLEFVIKYPEKGYKLDQLVWNKERANLSVLVKYEGTVKLPKNDFNIEEVETFKYNNYTVVKDGIINIKKLPISYIKEVEDILLKNNIKYEVDCIETDKNYLIIDLMSLPIINKSMVSDISVNEFANKIWELTKLQADKKVYDYYKKSLYPKESKSFIDKYGSEASNWLKEIGITDYNGFSPKTIVQESNDFYISINLETKLKGLSSLPKVEDVIKKLESGKELKISEFVMSSAILKYNEQLESDIYKSLNEEQRKEVLKTYLNNKSSELNISKRKLMQNVAQTVFSIILSKKWFKEFKSFDENTLDLLLDEKNVSFTFNLTEKEEKI